MSSNKKKMKYHRCLIERYRKEISILDDKLFEQYKRLDELEEEELKPPK